MSFSTLHKEITKPTGPPKLRDSLGSGACLPALPKAGARHGKCSALAEAFACLRMGTG
jgi:hypothetical protein